MLEQLLPYKNYIIALFIVLFTGLIIRITRWSIDKYISNASGKIKVDKTKYRFFKNGVSMLIWIFSIALISSFIPQLKSLAISLFAGAGILVAIIGFAAQEAFSNIIGGIFIVLFKPFSIGDMIKVGSLEYGHVEDITLRHTVILNFESKRIVIPNSVINRETIINDSLEDSKVCRFIEVGISYDSDLKKAMSIVRDICEKHPSCIDCRSKVDVKNNEPKVMVRALRFGDSSIDLRAYAWFKDSIIAIRSHSEINIDIKHAFEEAGIEIPFPHRTIVYKDQKNG